MSEVYEYRHHTKLWSECSNVKYILHAINLFITKMTYSELCNFTLGYKRMATVHVLHPSTLEFILVLTNAAKNEIHFKEMALLTN